MEEISKDTFPKKTNPFDRSNVISHIFFCWLLPFFKKGYHKDLTEDDIYQHRKEHDSGMLGDKLEKAWNYQVTTKRNPSFFKALTSIFIAEYSLMCLIALFSEIVKMAQPLLISNLLVYYDENTASENREMTYIYGVLIITSCFAATMSLQFFTFRVVQIGMRMRVACCSLVYRKSLKLSKTALAETTIGKMVNLLSNDVARFDEAAHFLHQLIFAPVEIFIVMYLCYNSVGWTGVLGAAFLLLIIPLQSYAGKKTSQFRLATALQTDERVRLMNEIISGIQVIKMYTWEKPFAKLVELIRRREIKFIFYGAIIRGLSNSGFTALNRTSIFLCILAYVLTGNTLRSSYTYTLSSFYRLLNSVTLFFPHAITTTSEMLISIKRIKQFLLYEELLSVKSDDAYIYKNNEKPKLISEKLVRNARIYLQNVSVKWLKYSSDNNLDNVNFDVTSGELVAVVGAVGSGKSTLLQVILQELLPLQGSVDVTGTISYASQEPWLFGGSIRQNILFGQQYDDLKYKEVIRVCELERDFTLLPYGDQTLASERGVSLSGGQRARINLARAIYKDADIYLLDDPLSAVDTHVGQKLFEECICGYLRGKCVILVTHQLQYLKNVKQILLLQGGRVVTSGSYENLKEADSPYSKMLVDIEEEEKEIRRKSRMSMKVKDQDEEQKPQILAREETRSGQISWHVYKNYMLAGGHWCKVMGLVILYAISQLLDTFTENFVRLWVNNEQTKELALMENSSTVFLNYSDPLNITSGALDSWWLDPVFNGNNAIIFYSLMFGLTVGTVLMRSVSLSHWCVVASTRMHNHMFRNILNGPMIFFNRNPSGRILNRFSKDIGVVDEIIPSALEDTIQVCLSSFAISILIGALSPFLFIPTAIIVVIFYLMRVVYLKTSRDIKRIESVTRSPIYTHLSASLQGLTTIRAFKAQEILQIEFDNNQNRHSASFFMFLGAARTFGFWLDFICLIYVALVVIFLVFINNDSYGGNVGLALTQGMALTTLFQYGMRQWTELENQMTSVERVQDYVDLKPEKDENVKQLSESWPQQGKIEFHNTYLKYSDDAPPVLKNLNFEIQPKEKIGIVGRTGAGKSSLIQALFRLADIDGSILIDDVDTKTIVLKKLRSKISIIPQEPVLFSSTLRKNLDPFDEYKDEVLWSALEEVELKNAVNDLPAGLDTKMAEGGSNFSVGQRQLVCLARAIVRNNKILVLDEATANVDPHTDGLIQKTIRLKFADCSVLTIAHRLHTIMDSDKVLVMDAGRSAEFDHPYLLLQNENSIFYSLVAKTGRATAKNLQSIAEENYLKKYQEQKEIITDNITRRDLFTND